LAGIKPDIENNLLRQDTHTFADLTDFGASIRFEHIFGGGFRFTSVSSATVFRMHDQVDSDGGVLPNYAARQISAGQLHPSDYEQLIRTEPRFENLSAEGNV